MPGRTYTVTVDVLGRRLTRAVVVPDGPALVTVVLDAELKRSHAGRAEAPHFDRPGLEREYI